MRKKHEFTGCHVGCPVEATLAVIGGKWKGIILYHLLQHETVRFNALQRAMPRVTRAVLTTQLREMERDNLVRRQVYAEVPPKVEYSLAPLGRSLGPIVEALRDWGREHLLDESGRPRAGVSLRGQD